MLTVVCVLGGISVLAILGTVALVAWLLLTDEDDVWDVDA